MEEIKGGVNPMTRGWNGYLVRALNEFVSLNAACRVIDASDRIPIRAKHQRNRKKSPGIRPRGKKISRDRSAV